MTYSELVTAIEAYTENYESSFVANIPVFVRQAEQRVYNTVQFPALRKNATSAMTLGNQYLPAPTDFLSVYSLAYVDPVTGAYEFLLNKDVNFIRQAYTNPSTTATPKYYAIFGPRSDAPTELTFLIGPTPDKAYSVELHYYFYPQSIVDAGTSWLGDNFDSVLLYGTLIEAYTFMKGEPDIIQLYDTKYKEALALAKRLGDGLDRQDAYRSGQARVPVS